MTQFLFKWMEMDDLVISTEFSMGERFGCEPSSNLDFRWPFKTKNMLTLDISMFRIPGR